MGQHEELSMMFREGTIYPNLQYSLMLSQEYCRGSIGNGRFPLMRNAGPDVYEGWVVNPNAPAEFWFTRRQEIIDEVAPDVFFVPLIPDPDLQNTLCHPWAVMKSRREWQDARKMYGEGFQFVFTPDPNDPRRGKMYEDPLCFCEARSNA